MGYVTARDGAQIFDKDRGERRPPAPGASS